MTVYGDTGEMLEWAESKILSLIGGRGGEEEEEIEYEEQAAELRFSDEDMSEFLCVQYCLIASVILLFFYLHVLVCIPILYLSLSLSFSVSLPLPFSFPLSVSSSSP